MFPKNNRLNLRAERDFFKKAKRKSTRLFQLLFVESDQKTPQFAVIVPKKVSLKATSRHKVLRRMRQALIHQEQLFEQKKVVAVMSRQALEKTVSDLENELLQVIDRS
jgi:ribonuclease P protein component